MGYVVMKSKIERGEMKSRAGGRVQNEGWPDAVCSLRPTIQLTSLPSAPSIYPSRRIKATAQRGTADRATETEPETAEDRLVALKAVSTVSEY